MNQLLRSPYFTPTATDAPTVPERSRESQPRRGSVARAEPIARLLVRREDRLVVVRVDEVDWLESAGNYVRLHIGQVDYLLRQTLAGLALHLDPRRFVKVHRTAIVNLDSIAEVLPGTSSDYSLRLNDGHELSVSRRHRRQLLACLGIS